jgi:hypothetical protein
MHIPGCPTHEQDILCFQEALVLADQPSSSYDVTQWLYVPPFYADYRYILGPKAKITHLHWRQSFHRRTKPAGQHPEIG